MEVPFKVKTALQYKDAVLHAIYVCVSAAIPK